MRRLLTDERVAHRSRVCEPGVDGARRSMHAGRVIALVPPGTVDPFVARPNLDGVVVGSLIEHRIGPPNSIEERAGVDLLMAADMAVRVEKMTAIEGHKGAPLKEKRPLPR